MPRRPFPVLLVIAVLAASIGAAPAENTRPDTSTPTIRLAQLAPTIEPAPSGPTIGPAPPGPLCEWVEYQKFLPAAACGYNSLNRPKTAEYRCGAWNDGEACVERCFFVKCLPGP